MLRAYRYAFILILLFQLFSIVDAKANESYLQSLTGKLKPNDSCVVIDDKFKNLPLGEWNQLSHLSVTNIVSFELRHDTSIFYYNKPFTCSLNVTIKYFTSRDQTIPDEISNLDLVVKFDTAKGATYPSIAQHRFKDAFKVVVVINSISSQEWGENIPAIFRIRNQILVDRRYPFVSEVTGGIELTSIGVQSNNNITLNSINQQQVGQQLQISWPSNTFPGSPECDIEWTFIDEESPQGVAIQSTYTTSNVIDIPDAIVESWMRNNSTRVTVKESGYKIYLPYPKGFVLVRVRGAQQQVTPAMRITTNWIYRNADNKTALHKIVNPHEGSLNYQYTASFAEEGKRKEVINYFDGTLNDRQAVTINNSDFTRKTENSNELTPTAVVAETIYDQLKRPTLSVLPAPTPSSDLNFIPDFNRNAGGIKAYSFKDLNINETVGLVCAPTATEMSDASGASNYYSSSNKFLLNQAELLEKPFIAYIPHAGKRPFSVIQYSADNSGRTRRSWAAGDMFQPKEGSVDPNEPAIGRPTEYHYGKPAQKELDRLFGSEAGNASHYLKNMIVDPNGQVSVAYLNSNGKTIATALAGNAPQNLEALSSSTKPESETILKRRMINKDDFRKDAADLKMQASSVFLAPLKGDFTIHYSVNPLALLTQHNNNLQQFCSGCYYEILVEVRDDCGNLVGDDPSTPFLINETTCNPNAQVFNKSFSVYLPRIGEYTITYTLRLSEQQIKYQTDYYIENNSDLLKLQNFFQEQLNKLDLQGCFTTCEECKTLGTQAEFLTRVKGILNNGEFAGISTTGNAAILLDARINAMYTQLKTKCDLIECGATNACETYLQMMKIQVRPGGQYALYTINEQTQEYSIAEPAVNVIPKFLSAETPDLTFINIAGNSVTRKSLSISDLIKEYLLHPEWADDLVKHHIEYCSYEWCKYSSGSYNNESSYNFDQTIRDKITSGQEAVDKQYYSNQTSALLDKDPFFASGAPGATYYNQMANDLSNYTFVKEIIVKDVNNNVLPGKNVYQYIDWLLYCKPLSEQAGVAETATSWTCNPSTACRSLTQQWEMYRNFYLQLKTKYVVLAKKQAKPNCINCYIGTDPLGENAPISGSCPLPGPCPSISQFDVLGESAGSETIGCYTAFKTNWFIYASSTFTQRVGIEVYQSFSDGENNSQIYYLEPGQTQIFVGVGVEYIGNVGCIPPANSQYVIGGYTVCAETPPVSMCLSHPNRDNYKNKIRVFNDYFDENRYATCEKPTNLDPAYLKAQALTVHRDRLKAELNESRVPNWTGRLKSIQAAYPEFSSITQTQLTNLVNGLKDISIRYLDQCSEVKDLAISSNVLNPSSPPVANDFATVFEQVIGNTLVRKGFTHYLLNDVYPSSKSPVLTNLVSSQLTTDICTNLANLKSKHISSGSSATFYDYLKSELGSDFILKPNELTDIENRCAASPSCRYLNESVTFPVSLTAVSGNKEISFIDFTTYNTHKTAFNNYYNTLSPTHELYEFLFASYINLNTGLTKTYEQYMAFEAKHAINSTAVLFNTSATPLIVQDELACTREQLRNAYERAGQEYDYYITQERKKFRNKYISTCLSNQATASIEGVLREYHYTLYYYDQSGNLVKTIPPEGVRFLNDAECELVDEFRNFPTTNCNGAGIPTTTDKIATLTSIENLWNAQTSKSLEMWIYSGESTADRQVRWVTANKKYMFQAAIHNKKLWVELYSLEGTGTDLSITLSNQVVADLSNITIQAWSHLVAQSSNFTTTEWTLYLDGKKLTLSNPATEPTYPFVWEIEPGPVVPADDLASLKHVRLYNRSLTDGEVTANFRNSCLSPVGVPAGTPMNLWARFNIPAPGSETTTGPGSTNEYVNRFIVPKHGLPSNYLFSSFNKTIKQSSPDGGTSEFWYDKLSRIVVSQNSEQKVPTSPADPANRYSFTKYDALGRIKEVGEKISGIAITSINTFNQQELASWYNVGTDRSIVQTIYEQSEFPVLSGQVLENVRNRVAASIFRETREALKVNASYFSYDISGNAKTVFQEIGELKALDNNTWIKKLEYDFDLISGKVNQVAYQKGKGDQFFYKYIYDADNRIKEALTSREGGNNPWILEARYSYYLHGPLARVELGKNNVQGVDYAYTLSGWLKAINGKDLIPGEDIGQDGVLASLSEKFSRDQLAFTLGYFKGDYKPILLNAKAISRNFIPEVFPPATPYAGTGASLYNGNISNTTIHIAPEILGSAKGYTYRYDQLNRLLTLRQHTGLPTGLNAVWDKTSGIEDYKEEITYDANGNILTFLRNSAGISPSERLMDNLTYHYNKNTSGELLNNKLRHVSDQVLSSAFNVDIDNQPVDNFTYDKIGNLIADQSPDPSQKLVAVKWTPYGKIASIQKTSNTISYQYDATGNRVWKSSSNGEKSTFYIRDPQGNVLAVYDYNAPTGSGGQGGTLTWAEQHLFGSERLGLWAPGITVTTSWQSPQPGSGVYIEGERTYELSNHLGNVLATISDKKIAVDQDGNGINDYFKAELLSATDYFSFGMQMPGRKWSLGNYRYGFNGQEMSNEIKGEGNSYTAEFWEYDPRIGRRWNLDPRPVMGYSSYSTFTNNPIVFSDPYGDTSVVGAGGYHKMEIDEKINKLEFYEPGKEYFISGSKSKVPIETGQLRAFSNEFGYFSARWSQVTDKLVGFEGYKNEKGHTYDEAVTELMSRWTSKVALWLKTTGDAGLRNYEADPVGHNLTVATTLLMMGASSIVTEPMPLSFSTRATTSLDDLSALGTLSIQAKQGTTALRMVGTVLESVDDVMANPRLLQNQSYGYVRNMLGNTNGWKNSIMTRTRGVDKGWVLRQVNSYGNETGKLIQYHPGSRRHFSGAPYWKISDGTTTTRFPAAFLK